MGRVGNGFIVAHADGTMWVVHIPGMSSYQQPVRTVGPCASYGISATPRSVTRKHCYRKHLPNTCISGIVRSLLMLCSE